MKKIFSLCILATLAITACNSKYEEPSPGKVKLTEGEIAQRAALTSSVDSKARVVEKAVVNLSDGNSILKQSLLKASFEPDKFVEILRQLNDEIQGQIPELENEEAIWIVRLAVNDKSLSDLGSDLCVSLRVPAKELSTYAALTKLTYFLMPCHRPAEANQILQATWSKEKVDLHMKSLESPTTSSIDGTEVGDISCTINKSDVTCKNATPISEKVDDAVVGAQ